MPKVDSAIIVGRNPVLEALRTSPANAGELLLAGQGKGGPLGEIIGLAKAAGVKVRRVERARLDELAGGAGHQGVALVLAASNYGSLEEIIARARQAGPAGLVVVADHIQDPHNLGAIIRSAAAFGAQGVVIPKDRACPLSPAVAKAAAGALAFLPVARVTNLGSALQQLKEAGLWALAAATRGAASPWDLDLNTPLALVVGSEDKGVSPRLLKECDLLATIPLAGPVESLNASVAAALLLYEVGRQRTAAPPPLAR